MLVCVSGVIQTDTHSDGILIPMARALQMGLERMTSKIVNPLSHDSPHTHTHTLTQQREGERERERHSDRHARMHVAGGHSWCTNTWTHVHTQG